jgi:hypothetical protein
MLAGVAAAICGKLPEPTPKRILKMGRAVPKSTHLCEFYCFEIVGGNIGHVGSLARIEFK